MPNDLSMKEKKKRAQLLDKRIKHITMIKSKLNYNDGGQNRYLKRKAIFNIDQGRFNIVNNKSVNS